MDQPTVLVVEDDAAIRQALVDALRFAGLEPIPCESGELALETAAQTALDLVLLDVMLPGMDGFTVLSRLRARHPRLPIIMVTARGAEQDRIHGLVDGADDYVVKPFSARELLARVQAVLRRAPERSSQALSLRAPGGHADLQLGAVSWDNGRSFRLTEREIAVLRYLASTPGRPIARDELLRGVWGVNPAGLETRTVDMHVTRLREKLSWGEAPIVVTVRGQGYALAAHVEVEFP